ncbi:MAG: radical SAM protein [Labilithrix sp.]|nr:radical SAM protein [Labilithrix sp.]MCW5817212.1 radical SAM protein [Labilithrix sp.]
MTLRDELRRRMALPQRHRLLQGYPMAPLMQPAARGTDPLAALDLDPARPLIVGVLPHTFCNPKVRGCGFCTFPHEKFGHEPMRRTVREVAREIEAIAARAPSLRGRRVEAVYFGGGTANLTPPAELERLCRVLASTFDLADSELTLEGVPSYFLLREEALLDVLERTGVRHRRISMGIQTFDHEWLRRMGRDAFGDRAEVESVVRAAHRRGMTASADLLFNLPGAPRAHALADVRTAMELGFDQICTYNLVLRPELDTVWARDQALVRAMPSTTTAAATWLAVREFLLAGGYVQTTLTNFERADVAETSRRFVYERASFSPARRDAIGFGPGAISTFTSRDRQRATKWMNAGTSEVFVERMVELGTAVAGTFDYSALDLRLLHLTRNLARLAIDNAEYEAFFGETPLAGFAVPFEALEEAGLVRRDSRTIELTPLGMFYADAAAGLLAHHRVAEIRRAGDENQSTRHHMG